MGWAADIETGRPADSVLIFVDDDLVYSGTPTFNRDDVATAYDQEGVRASGFAIDMPRDRLDGTDGRIRVFGLTETGSASELKVSAQALELFESLGR